PADLRVTAAQDLKTVGRSAANRRFTGQKDDCEISSFGQPDQRNQRRRAVEDCLDAWAAHCRCLLAPLAGFHEEGLAFFIAASTMAGSSSGLICFGGTTSLLRK